MTMLYCKFCDGPVLGFGPSNGDGYTVDEHRGKDGLCPGSLTSARPYREICKTVFTNGCFDLISSAHCEFLRESRSLGDHLIVGLNTDASIRQLKGNSRPIVPYDQREEVLRSLRCVDVVIPLPDAEPSRLIRVLSPNIVTKAKGYTRETMPEWEAIEEVGGRVVFLPTYPGLSTTAIVEKCRSRHQKKKGDIPCKS